MPAEDGWADRVRAAAERELAGVQARDPRWHEPLLNHQKII